ncbi:MAG: heavy metal translocating P-type ATPase, partial [Candidatus Nezhaarchaeota archaeon]|nr:heavy metal translocating P-type ATPase [Candidatus Nezhaarchaeota archaeon]
LRVSINPHTLSPEALDAVAATYRLTRRAVRERIERPLLSEAHRRLAASAVGIPVLLMAMLGHHVGVDYSALETLTLAGAMLVLLASYDVAVKGLRSLARAAPTMDSLVALSTCSTFIVGLAGISGLIELTLPPLIFFEASVGVLAFVSLGKLIEHALRRRALSTLYELELVLQGKARRVEGGSVRETPVEELKAGDVIEVRSGDVIPVDGVVVEGWGYVDEASFTGEPLPKFKSSEERPGVLAGTRLTSGYIKVRVSRAGRETLMYEILEAVREAHFRKPRLQALADRLVGTLAWVVLTAAALTFTAWLTVTGDLARALMFTAAVLVVACPCPLGIAIPLATSLGVLLAARRGVLIRGGDVFERTLKSTAILLDKTGTVTIGRPAVEAVHVLNNISEEEVLSLACSAEKRSEHVLAKALLEYCSKLKIELEEPEGYEPVPGLGVLASVRGKSVAVGGPRLAEALKIQLGAKAERLVKSLSSTGSTPIVVAVDGRPAAVIEVRDSIRSGTKEVLRRLKGKGLRVGLVSGDAHGSVERVAKEVEADFFYYELRPEEKAELVEGLQAKGEGVAYVGDGINDSLAISRAHVGVAMGSGAGISKLAGDVVLLGNSLAQLELLYALSSKVRRKIYENLFWAFIYNATLIPVAAGALYPLLGVALTPEMAALAMALSNVSVVANSTLLLREKLA